MRRVSASIRAPLGISGSLVSFARITRVASCPGVDGHVSTGSNDHQDPFRYFSPSCSLPPLSTPRLNTSSPHLFAPSFQNAWAIFLFYVAFSKYGKIKLGRADEKPEFNNISWFAMLFSCGIAVGVYTLGVAEPMAYYRKGVKLNGRGDVPNDDERAQQALLQTFYHWGLHAWAPYITVALGLGSCCRGSDLGCGTLWHKLTGALERCT